LYSKLEELFGLDSLIIPGGISKDPDKEKDGAGGRKAPPKPPSQSGWRDLIPVIKLELSCVSFQN
jgi:hypothetical protein